MVSSLGLDANSRTARAWVKPTARLVVPLAFAARKPSYICSMSSAVRQNDALSRFELDVEGDIAFASYRLADRVVAITYVEVPRSLRQRGVGSRLMLGVLAAARAQGLKVRPLCSFARFVVAQHPEFHDVAG